MKDSFVNSQAFGLNVIVEEVETSPSWVQEQIVPTNSSIVFLIIVQRKSISNSYIDDSPYVCSYF